MRTLNFEIRDQFDSKITDITVHGETDHQLSEDFVRQLFEKSIFQFRYQNPYLHNWKNKDGFCDGRLTLEAPNKELYPNTKFLVGFEIDGVNHNSYDVA